MPHIVVFPAPWSPHIMMTVGSLLATLSLLCTGPISSVSCSLTIFITCCAGVRLLSTCSPTAFSLTSAINCFATDTVYVGFQQSDAHLAHGLLYFQLRQRSAVGQLGKNMIYSLTESRKQCHSFSPRRLRAFPQAPPRHLFPDTMFSAFCKFRGFLRFFLQSPNLTSNSAS